MKITTKSVRVRIGTWNRLRASFKAEKGETFASYLDRLAKFLNYVRI